MKKLLVAGCVSCMMSVSAMAGTYVGASIDSVKVSADGSVKVVVTEAGASIANLFDLATATVDGKKAVLAALLTAKASTGIATIRFSGASITEVGY